MSEKILRHQDLIVYKKAIEAAMNIFEVSKSFPKEETYSLTENPAGISFRPSKYCRSMEKAALQGCFHQQT